MRTHANQMAREHGMTQAQRIILDRLRSTTSTASRADGGNQGAEPLSPRPAVFPWRKNSDQAGNSSTGGFENKKQHPRKAGSSLIGQTGHGR
jgi:hypothetical protein